ncbi:MAG: hypothetical protein IJ560_04290 [Alphaproteobacteria bacterium]|nr:hypothetical protein [Alphaproteobacteria bacterium]
MKQKLTPVTFMYNGETQTVLVNSETFNDIELYNSVMTNATKFDVRNATLPPENGDTRARFITMATSHDCNILCIKKRLRNVSDDLTIANGLQYTCIIMNGNLQKTHNIIRGTVAEMFYELFNRGHRK